MSSEADSIRPDTRARWVVRRRVYPVRCWHKVGKVGVSETELARAASQAGISSVKMLGKSGEDSERLKQCGRQAARIKRGDAKACPLQEALDANNGGKHGVRF